MKDNNRWLHALDKKNKTSSIIRSQGKTPNLVQALAEADAEILAAINGHAANQNKCVFDMMYDDIKTSCLNKLNRFAIDPCHERFRYCPWCGNEIEYAG